MRGMMEGEEGGRGFTSTSHTAAGSVSSNHGNKESGENVHIITVKQ